MAAQNEAPPGRAGLLDINSVAGSDIESSQKHVHVQEAIAALRRDFAAEALRVAAIKRPTQLMMCCSVTTLALVSPKVFAGCVYRDDGATSETSKRARGEAALRYFGLEPSDIEIEIAGATP
jgi:hypothetical protein